MQLGVAVSTGTRLNGDTRHISSGCPDGGVPAPWSEADHNAVDSPSGVEDTDGGRPGIVPAGSPMLYYGLDQVLMQHSCPENVRQDLFSQLDSYFKNSDELTVVAKAKLLLSSYMAVYLRNDLPVTKVERFVATGSWRRWSRARLNAYCRKNTHLWWSFYQAKRAADEVPESFIRYTYEKHRAQMLSPDPLATPGQFCSAFPDFFAGLRRLLRETDLPNSYFPEVPSHETPSVRGTLIDRDTLPVTQPFNSVPALTASKSACFELGRGGGGQAEILFSRYVASDGDSLVLSPEPAMIDIVFRPHAIVNGVLRFNACVTLYSYEDRAFLLSVRETELAERSADTRLAAEIRGVIEPLKVRVISKGPAAAYYASKPLQIKMHTSLRRTDFCRLLGRPVSPTDLMDLHAATFSGGESTEDFYWMSIDYSAATDGLSAGLSREILSRWLLDESHSFEDWVRWSSVLGLHRIFYPKESGLEPVDEQNGQLMGSILSFPVLCVANVLVYLAVCAACPIRSSWTLERQLAGVLVNGDDMLYIGTKENWATHVALGQQVGLEMSIGKAYQHKRYASVNSQCFDCDLETGHAYMVDYFNSGLFVGQRKVHRVTAEEDNEVPTLVSAIPKMLNGVWGGDSVQCRVLADFLRRNGKTLRDECRGRNIFIAESLGGCGVKPPSGFQFNVTEDQLLFAHERLNSLRADGAVSLVPDRPGPWAGEKVETLDRPTAPWDGFQKEREVTRLRVRRTLDPATRKWVKPHITGRKLSRSDLIFGFRREVSRLSAVERKYLDTVSAPTGSDAYPIPSLADVESHLDDF